MHTRKNLISTMSTVLVQGASRGIGQALVRTLLLRTPYDVIATCRDPETSQSQITSTLDSSLLRRLFVYKLDVIRESTIVNCSEQVKKNHGEKPLRLLINSAGILHVEESLDQINVDLMAENFQTNATGSLEAHREELEIQWIYCRIRNCCQLTRSHRNICCTLSWHS